MKLTTKAIVEEFKKYPIHSQAHKGGDAHIICKYALPSNTFVLYILEAEPMKLDKYDEMATGFKAGDTWALRGIVFNEQNPRGKYRLYILAELEQTKVITRLNSEDEEHGEYVEEWLHRDKEFKPCKVSDVVEDITALTAGEFCEDLPQPPTTYDIYKAMLGQAMEEQHTAGR